MIDESRSTRSDAVAGTPVGARAGSSFKRHLLAGTAVLALLAGSLGTLALHAETRSDPFGTPSRPAAEAKVTMPDFVPIVDAVKPAVVSVRVKSKAAAQMSDGGDANPFEGTPFDRFFRQFGGPEGRFGNGVVPRLVQAQGSGFFISPDGYLVTNNHVVDHAVSVQIVMDDGTELEAKVVGTDKRTDLALLKVEGRDDLPFVKLATGSPKIGSWVLAVGNPFGLGGTVTTGIVSAKGRDIGNGPYDDYIQIDAPVNRGNSGGPTFNLDGQVVGVNTAIYSPSGGSVGIAFDIPAETVRSVVGQLRERGHVERGWLGVQIQPVTKSIADSLGLADAHGALVTEPQPDSPAARAGLKSGDIVDKVDGREVKDSRSLARLVAGYAPGTEVMLTVLRDGKPQQVKVMLGRFEEQVQRKAAAPRGEPETKGSKLGLRLAPASEVEGAGDAGLVVLSVEPGGAAADAGIAAGDVILRAGGAPAASSHDLTEALRKARSSGKKHTLALVRHGDSERYVALPVG